MAPIAPAPTYVVRCTTLSNGGSSDDLLNMYEVTVKSSPPRINLERTPALVLFGPAFNVKLLAFARAHFKMITGLNRVGVLIIFALWAAPAGIAQWITPFATALSLPIVIFSPLLMSTDLLRLLFRQHEYWFFTATNLSNWTIASILFGDARVTGCIMCFLMAELAVLMDANFRTIGVGVRTSIAWIPAIICIVIICTTRIVDIAPERFNVLIPRNKIGYNLANWFLNVNTTLVIFLGRQTFRRRRILTRQFLLDRIIPCCTIRCDLVVQSMRCNDAASKRRFATFTAIRKASGTIDPNASFAQAAGVIPDGERVGSSPVQEMRVVTPTLSFLDMRNTLIPALTPARRISVWTSTVHCITGLVGLLAAGITMYLPAEHDINKYDTALLFGIVVPKGTAVILIPTASLACTILFVVPFVASYQRDLLRAMKQNFEFCFTSPQFLISAICVADMMHWDFHCLALISWVLWIHWILLRDVLLPDISARFRFKKVYGTPALVGIFVGLLWILYSIFISSYDALYDRVLTVVKFDTHALSIRTSTSLIGRIATILTWSIRVVWRAARTGENDLVFICGRLEYHTPMEFFPTVASAMDTQASSSPPAQHSIRRIFRTGPPIVQPSPSS